MLFSVYTELFPTSVVKGFKCALNAQKKNARLSWTWQIKFFELFRRMPSGVLTMVCNINVTNRECIGTRPDLSLESEGRVTTRPLVLSLINYNQVTVKIALTSYMNACRSFNRKHRYTLDVLSKLVIAVTAAVITAKKNRRIYFYQKFINSKEFNDNFSNPSNCLGYNDSQRNSSYIDTCIIPKHYSPSSQSDKKALTG